MAAAAGGAWSSSTAIYAPLTERVAADTRTLLRCGRTPPPEYEAAKCEACSLQELCQPRKPHGTGVVDRWVATAIDG